ncbi:MAG: hypothetical protein M1827_002729 [Pycnora praestabilis]|nr:MAG: hypothetical protein M1827_002729 [Pycnora praestabilis]
MKQELKNGIFADVVLAAPDVTPEDDLPPSAKTAIPLWFRVVALALLLANYFVAQYDKFILSYFQTEVLADLHISSEDYGILSGYATGIVYALLAIPVAYLADSTQRRIWILMICTLWWSICVIFQGLSHNFWQILLARIGMGIGQSAVEALSISLISDYMRKEWVLFGNSVLYVGVYVGEAISSQIANAFKKTNTPWNSALKAIGIVGLVIAVVIRIVLREPLRQSALVDRVAFQTKIEEKDEAGNISEKRLRWIRLKESFIYVVRMKSFWLLSVSSGFRQLGGNVFGYYMPSYLQLLYPDIDNFISNYGIIVGVVGTVAVLAGGLFCSFMWTRTVLMPVYITAIGGMISSVFVILMVFSQNIASGSEIKGAKVLYATMSLAYITAELWLGALATLVVFLFPPEYKTFAYAIYQSIYVLIYSAGPQIIGLAIEDVDPTSAAYLVRVRIVLAVFIPVSYWLAGIGFLFCIPLIRQDLRRTIAADKASQRRVWGLWAGAGFLGCLTIGLFVSSLTNKNS